VAQKERIKEIAKNLDVLSLSATPIPRTLQMSLLTIRPMSILEDAPQNRLPVKTYVCQENDGLIKEGKIKHIGLSNENPWGVMRFLMESEKHGLPRISTIQNPFSLFLVLPPFFLVKLLPNIDTILP
jgi:RecG-like helicase